MKKTINLSLVIFLFFLSLFIIFKPFLNKNFPYTHDGENHLVRFANYYLALKQGQIPPRFAPHLMNKYGYPVFNYNYPLANILSLPFTILNFHYEFTFKIICVLAVFFALYSLKILLKYLGYHDFKFHLLAFIIFLQNNYLINAIYFRGNIGELLAMCIFPYLLYSILKLSKPTNRFEYLFFILAWTAFFLSHNIAVLIAAICFFILIIFIKPNLNYLKKLIILLLISFGLASWFWLPAILEKNQVILDTTTLNTDYQNHFVDFKQLIFNLPIFGFSYPGSSDNLSFAMTYLQIFILVFALVILIKSSALKSLKNQQIFYFALFSIILFIFLETKSSLFFYQFCKVFSFVQFPWRFAIFQSTFIVLIFIIIKKLFNSRIFMIFSFLLLFQSFLFLKIQNANTFHKENIDYEHFGLSTSTLYENLPKTFTYGYKISDYEMKPTFIKGTGNFNIKIFNSTHKDYELELDEEAIIVEPTMYFLGFETTANGQKIEYIDNEEIAGRIAFKLPKGNYHIQTRFTQKTPARIMAHLITLGSLFFLIFIIKQYEKIFK